MIQPNKNNYFPLVSVRHICSYFPLIGTEVLNFFYIVSCLLKNSNVWSRQILPVKKHHQMIKNILIQIYNWDFIFISSIQQHHQRNSSLQKINIPIPCRKERVQYKGQTIIELKPGSRHINSDLEVRAQVCQVDLKVMDDTYRYLSSGYSWKNKFISQLSKMKLHFKQLMLIRL